jgi:uncharacterized membrane protein YdbT with pleckstrin-like domain
MSDDWWFRRPDEEVVWRGQPRLSAAVAGVVVGAVLVGLALLGAVVVDPWVAAGSLLGIGVAGWAVLRVQRTEYLLTTRALWLKRGAFGRSVRRVGTSRVQNTAYNQSVTGSMFGHGTVTATVAGGRDLQFRRIDDPETVRTAITERIGTADDGVPGSTEQWRSALSLARDIRTAVE